MSMMKIAVTFQIDAFVCPKAITLAKNTQAVTSSARFRKVKTANVEHFCLMKDSSYQLINFLSSELLIQQKQYTK